MYCVSLYNVYINSYAQFDKIVIKTYMFFKFFYIMSVCILKIMKTFNSVTNVFVMITRLVVCIDCVVFQVPRS